MLYHFIAKEYARHVYRVWHNEYLFKKNKTAYDILLLGTSRMKDHINPVILDSITGMNSYNAAIEGSSAFENTMILKAYLLHHKAPKYIFLSADIRLICNNKTLTVPISYITCDDIAPISEALKKCGMPMNLYHAIPFLKLTELTDNYKLSFLYKPAIVLKHGKEKGDQKGFANNFKAPMDTTARSKPYDSDIKTEYLDALDELIKICKQNEIQLVFVYTPEYKHYYTIHNIKLSEILAEYSNRANKYDIPFLKYDTIAICNDSRYFRDGNHLNATGATLFSQIFAHDILQKGIIHRP
ncbi:MAG: hypothetical protein JST82_16730 [Bacteroidetes bacterium]|nr:hypothetical protein [Bacteroidota bacterium]